MRLFLFTLQATEAFLEHSQAFIFVGFFAKKLTAKSS